MTLSVLRIWAPSVPQHGAADFSSKSVLVLFCAAIFLTSAAQAAPIADFVPQPTSPAAPELVFAGAGGGSRSLSTGSGAIGNGDGTSPVGLQTPGGLEINTPFVIPGIAGSSVNVSSTTFYDATLTLAGLGAPAPATIVGPVIVQPLTAGSFTILSTDPPGAATSTVLLTGTIADAAISALSGAATGAVLSATVTYTGGAIHTALVSGGGTTTGDLSWSFLDATPLLGVDGQNFLLDFAANATGLFSTPELPEPSLGMLAALAGVGMFRRRNRHAS